MSKTIEERVVEIKFNNSKFEQNVQTSLNSVDKLKKSLNFDNAAKGFESASKASNELAKDLYGIDAAANSVSLDAIANSVASLEKRFSTLGIVGMRVITNLVDSAMNMASRITGFVTGGIVTGGINRAMNLENANFKLEGLLKDEKKVAAVMDNVSESVDGTAYSLDAAAVVASSFAGSGLEAGEDMLKSLKAVAGVAAMTNSEYGDIGAIFTTVNGQGRLMADQLNQLAGRGLNAAATLADYLGKSETQVREMVSKGKVSFKTFSDAMYEAFGEHAKKANETFSGAMSNIKAALGRIGAKFVSPLVEQNGSLVKLFNSVRLAINRINECIDPLANKVTGAIKNIADGISSELTVFTKSSLIKYSISNIITSIINSFKALSRVIVPIGEALSEVFNLRLTGSTAQGIYKLTDLLKKFTAGLILSETESNNLKRTFKGLFAIISLLGTIFTTVFGAIISGIFPAADGVSDLSGSFLELTAIVGDWLVNINDTIKKSKQLQMISNVLRKIFQILGTVIGGLVKVIGPLAEFIFSIVGYVADAALTFADWAIQSGVVDNAIKAVTDTASKFGKVIEDAAASVGIFLSNITGIKNLEELGQVMSSVGLAVVDFIFPAQQVYAAEKDLADSTYADSTQKNFNTVSDSISNFIKVSTPLSGIVERVAAAFDYIKTGIERIKNGETILTIVKDAIADFFGTKQTKTAVSGAETIKSSFGNISSVFKTVADTITNSFESIKNVLHIKSLDDVGNVLGKTAGFVLLFKVFNVLQMLLKNTINLGSLIGQTIAEIGKLLKQSIQNINEFISSLTRVAKSYAKKLDAEAFDIYANAFIKIGKCLIAIAAALFIISLIPTEKLVSSALALGFITATVAGIIVGIMYLKSYLDSGKKVIGKAAASAWELADKGISQLVDALKAIGGEFAKGFKMISLGIMAVAFVAALWLLADAIQKFNDLKLDNMKQAIGLVAGSIVGLGIVLGKLATACSGSAGNLIGAAFMLLALMFALEKLVDIFKLYDSVNFEELSDGIKRTAGALAVLLGATYALSQFAKGSAGSSFSGLIGVAAVILSLGISLTLIADALNEISSIDSVALERGVDSLLKIIVAVGGVVAVLALLTGSGGGQFAKVKGAGAVGSGGMAAMLQKSAGVGAFSGGSWKQLLGVAAAILSIGKSVQLIAGALANIANIPQSSLDKGVGALTAIMVDLAIVVAAAGQFKGSGGGITALALLLVVLTGALMTITLIPVEGIIKSVVALGVILVALGKSMAMAANFNANFKSVISLAIMVVSVAAALFVLSLIDIPNLVAAAGSLSAVMFALVAAMYILSKAEIKIANVVTMLAVLVVVGLVLGLLANFSNADDILKIAGSLCLIFVALSVMMVVAGAIGAAATAAIPALAIMVLALGAVALILGLLANSTNALSVLVVANALSELLLALSVSLLILAAVGALGPAAFIGLGALAALFVGGGALAAIIGALMEIDGARELLQSGLSTMEMLGEGLGRAVGAIIKGVLEKSSEALPTIGKSLSDFMSNASGFFTGLKRIDDSTLASALILCEILLAMTASEVLSRIISFFGGNSIAGITSFTEAFPLIGDAIAKFSQSVTGIKSGSVKIAADSAKSLVDVIKAFPASGGIVQSIFGEKDTIAEFASQLPILGMGLKQFSIAIAGLDKGVVENSAAAAETLITLSNKLPSSGGIVQSIFGEKDTIAEFASQLPILGMGLKQFSIAIAGLDKGVVENSAAAAETLITLSNKLPSSGGIVQSIFGEKCDMDTFGAQLKGFGTGLAAYGTSVSGLPIGAMKLATEEASRLVDLFVSFQNVSEGPIQTFVNGLEQLGRVSVTNFTQAFTTSEEVVRSAVSTMILAASSALVSEDEKYRTLGVNIVNAFSEGISTSTDKAKTAVTKFIEALLKHMSNFDDDFNKVGAKLMEAFVRGVNSARPNAYTAGGNVSRGVYDGLQSNSDLFTSVGENLISGMIQGLSDKADDLYTAIREIIKKALKAAEDEADINSPSKKTYAMGEYLDQGLINGLISMSGAVNTAVSDVTSSALDTIRTAINDIPGIDEMNVDPVIRPVVDLSNVEQSANAVNSMFTDNAASVIASGIYVPNKGAAKADEMNAIQEAFKANAGLKSDLSSLYNRFEGLQQAISSNNDLRNDTANIRSDIAGLQASLTGFSSNGDNIVIHNTFAISGAQNPKDIANKINSILQKQVDRRSAVWG